MWAVESKLLGVCFSVRDSEKFVCCMWFCLRAVGSFAAAAARRLLQRRHSSSWVVVCKELRRKHCHSGGIARS